MVTPGPSVFDLLRSSQRRIRQASGVGAGGICDEGGVDSLRTRPLSPTNVGVDEHTGLWWTVEAGEVRYFPLVGAQWPPASVHVLPSGSSVSARCVALLAGPGHGGARDVGPCAVVVHDNLRISVYPQGERVDLPRPEGLTRAHSAVFVQVAAALPNLGGAIGSILVVATAAGRLFSLCVRQLGDTFSAEAGPLWPMEASASGFAKWFRRPHSLTNSSNSDLCAAGSTAIRSVQVVTPPADTDALFAALVLTESALGLFLHSGNASCASLVWVAPAADLVTTSPALLLAVKVTANPFDGLTLLHTGLGGQGVDEGAKLGQRTLLSQLQWPARREPPRPSTGDSLVLGPAPLDCLRDWTNDLAAVFLIAFGATAVAAVHMRDHVYRLSTVSLSRSGMMVTDTQMVESGVLGLAALTENTAGRIAVLTPHGLLDCPRESALAGLAQLNGEQAKIEGSDDALQVAHELYTTGQEVRAKTVVAHVFSTLPAPDLLGAIERRTTLLLDASDTSGPRWAGVQPGVATRHLLYDKMRDIQQWLGFLAETGVWTRLGNAPGVISARQHAAEASERVAAAARLREMDDQEPEVFAAAVQRAITQDRFRSLVKDSQPVDARAFYNCVSATELLFDGLADYPRSFPLGSGHIVEAVLRVNGAAVAFLEAALERRAQVAAVFPTLLPPADATRLHTTLEGAARAPSVVGSAWLLSPQMRRALEEMRLVNLEVIPTTVVKGHALLDAQALRIVDSLQALCRATLRAAHACYVDLHAKPMVQLRKTIVEHLADAERSLSQPSPAGNAMTPRAMALAEEFEDYDALVSLSTRSRDLSRLDHFLEKSPTFRAYALASFLQDAKLQPLFFRTMKRFDLSAGQLEELLAPHPEIRWTLELHRLGEQPSEEDWQVVLDRIERRATSVVHKERDSVAKRDAFAALVTLARAAAGRTPEATDAMSELASLGRLRRVCLRFDSGTSPAVGAKRPHPDEPPPSGEALLVALGSCAGAALGTLRADRRETRFLSDAALLVRYIEHGLLDRGVDVASLSRASSSREVLGEDERVLRSLQRLWSEIILADAVTWKEVLLAPAGVARDARVGNSGFCQMLAAALKIGTQGRGLATPYSANLEHLCAAFEALQHFAPALRIAEQAAISQSTEKVYGGPRNAGELSAGALGLRAAAAA